MFSLVDPAKQCSRVVVLTYTLTSSVWSFSCSTSLRGKGFLSVWFIAIYHLLDQCLAYAKCSIHIY